MVLGWDLPGVVLNIQMILMGNQLENHGLAQQHSAEATCPFVPMGQKAQAGESGKS